MPLYSDIDDLEDLVIHFHDLLRMIESKIGTTDLTRDIRRCAQELKILLKEKQNE